MVSPSGRSGAFGWRDWAALAALLLFTLLFHWPLITPDLAQRQSYPEGDFYDQFHAFAFYEHERLWDGAVPLWNPYTFGGHPFLADVQAAVWYPPSLLVMLLSGPGPFSPGWLQAEAIAHLYLAAALMYLFVRHLVGLRLAALISALAFGFGGYMTSYPPLQLAILETQAWLPLILLLLDLGLSRRRPRLVVTAGLVWGVSLLAGHPQSAMYVFYVALCYALFCAWRYRVRWPQAAVAQLAWIGVGAALAGVYLLPSWEYMRLSVRASAAYEELTGGLGWRDLVQYVLPGQFTHWSPVYVGIMPLLLALAAVVLAFCRTAGLGLPSRGPLAVLERKKCAPCNLDAPLGIASGTRRPRNDKVFRGADVAFWAGLALFALVLSLGGRTPLYRLFYWIVPGFNLFRSQERAIYVTGLALAVLASYGWSWVDRWLGGWVARRLGGGVIGWRAVAGWLVLGAIALDLWAANGGVNLAPGRAQERVYDGAWLAPLLQDGDLFRTANEWGLPGNVGCWLGLQDLYGASPLRLLAHKTMADAMPHWRLWQLFGVRYVAGWEHDLSGPIGAHRVAIAGQEWEKDTVYVHRLQADLPRAWVVYRARQVDDLEALQIMASPDFDPFAEVLIASPGSAYGAEASALPDFASGEREGTARVEVAYAPEEIVIDVNLSTPGWLVLGEWFYPGWQAWVNGARAPIYRADYGLRALPLPTGSHYVVFRYRPVSVAAGAAISALALSATLAALLVCRKQAARRGKL